MKLGVAIVVFAIVSAAHAADSQYQGQETREIKALSPSEIQGYLAGAGMGFAKPAELNHYPGPKHVLELAEPLALTDEQRVQTQQAFDRMHERAVALGKDLVEREHELDAMFAQENGDTEALRQQVLEVARVRGELRFVHLQAHVEMKALLTAEQCAAYDRLRGYATD